jgi:hypothetical protein
VRPDKSPWYRPISAKCGTERVRAGSAALTTRVRYSPRRRTPIARQICTKDPEEVAAWVVQEGLSGQDLVVKPVMRPPPWGKHRQVTRIVDIRAGRGDQLPAGSTFATQSNVRLPYCSLFGHRRATRRSGSTSAPTCSRRAWAMLSWHTNGRSRCTPAARRSARSSGTSSSSQSRTNT